MTRGPVVSNTLGVTPGPPDKAFVYNRTGAARAVGDAVMIDMAQSATETTSAAFGDAAGCWANAVLPATALLGHGVFGVVSGLLGNAGADNTLLEVTLTAASIDCNVIGANAAAPGDPITPANGVDTWTSNVLTNGSKIVGICLGTTAGPSEEAVACMIDGWGGFGAHLES